MIGLPDRQRDDCQRWIFRGARRKLTAIGHEKVRHIVRLAPFVDDAIARLLAHAVRPEIVRRRIGGRREGTHRSDGVVKCAALLVGVAAHRDVISMIVEMHIRDRQVELIVKSSEAPPLEIEVLGQMIQSLTDDHPHIIPGVFVKDLQTGEELGINEDVAFAGLSLLKVAILEETYRTLDAPLDLEVTDWISDSLGVTSSNFKANLLLRDVIGEGDGYQGAQRLTASMNYLGLPNTFMVAPYDAECPFTIQTPANSRTDITTNPDICMQTTPLDMGLLLEMIYQCRQGGGTLMAAYPGAFTAGECSEMVEQMTRNSFDNLIETELPEGTIVAHKHGFGTEGPHADAGIVFSPNGDFIVVIYLDSPQYLEWAESSGLVANIAKATYNYFNPAH